jgi:serine/threonine-protein kinase
VPVHDVGVDPEGRYYFVMKHVQGQTLEEVIKRLAGGDAEAHARFPFPVRVQLFLSMLQALAHAHRRGVIHRDLKPANLMVGPHNEVTVMDWGVAKVIRPGGAPLLLRESGAPACALPLPALPAPTSTRRTEDGALIGSPAYMSPEQARGDITGMDERSDLYSLCVVFHELLFLEHYLGEGRDVSSTLAAVQTQQPHMHDMSHHPAQRTVPRELAWFIDRGLQKAPQARFQSADEMIAELQRILSGRIRVQCQVTLVKRAGFELLALADAHPAALIVGSTLTLSLFAVSLWHLLKGLG